MRFGIYLDHNGPASSPEALKRVAIHTESLGFDSMVVGDHIVVPTSTSSRYPYSVGGGVPWGGQGEHLEQLTLLTFLAGATSRIRIVPSVMIVPYRHPILAAKMLASMDVLSGGRLTVGIGVGWLREEFEAMGAPSFEERGAATDEYIRAMKELWTSDAPSFEGKYIRFRDIHFSPKPVQRPHPPIWVGGQSRPALRRAATLGDAWHPIGATPASPLEPEEFERSVAYMRRHAESVGRDPAEIGVALKAPLYDSTLDSGGARRRFSGTPEQIVEDVQLYERMGVTDLVFDTRDPDVNRSLERLSWLREEIVAKV